MQFSLLDTNILSPDEGKLRMLRDDVNSRCKAANQRDAEAWAKVKCRDDWDKFRTRAKNLTEKQVAKKVGELVLV